MKNNYLYKITIEYSNYFLLFLLLHFGGCNHSVENNNFLFNSIENNLSGLDFTNTVIENEDFNILEYLYYYNGGGVAIGDINNDGLDDIFLTSNQGQDKLFLNLGKLKFKDITSKSGINHSAGWSTGVNIVDIDGDGWKDIYVCRLGQYKIYQDDYNRVYINDKKGKFQEKSQELGLHFSGFSTQCTFFDIDQDGDLDAYLLNHSVKDASHFKPSDIRNTSDTLAGDVLYENRNGLFYTITASSGIYHSSIGYGLGITVADFNNDGWQDLYVCNDFHENDYLYLNQKNKTFKEVCKESFGHTSNFSMGVDCDDMDNDGLIDIFSVDMKPDDELIYKNSGGWENLQIYNFKRSYGYHHQQPKNGFQWNRGINSDHTPVFSEISGLLNLDATDWSWSPVIADFDLDGNKDIFVTNGIKRRPNDLDFVHFISNESGSIGKPDTVLIQTMPEGKRPNHFFRNNGGMQFAKVDWMAETPTLSNGAAAADLDNDGDIDLVINNFNAPVTLLENTTNFEKNITLILKNTTKNTEAIGARITVFDGIRIQYFIVKANQGFQSSGSREIIFSTLLPNIDSIKILWPEGEIQTLKGLTTGKTHFITKEPGLKRNVFDNALVFNHSFSELPGIIHTENDYNDQVKESWIPFLLSAIGPKITISKNGIAYMTNSKNSNGILFDAKSGNKLFEVDKGLSKAAVDETNATFFDANGDGLDDLYMCLGGNEVKNGGVLLSDLLYIQHPERKFLADDKMLPKIPLNTSVAAPCDYDRDGDIDIFAGTMSAPGSYGLSEFSYLLQNNNNKSFSQKLIELDEMVFDAKWADVDGNGYDDLIVCGHWMPITIFYNEKGTLRKEIIPDSEGLWFTIAVDDLNADGFPEIIAGNFGNNHSLKCNPAQPLMLYINDFDNNGQTESLLTYIKNDKRYIFPNRDMFVGQLPGKKKLFLKNKDLAGKTLNEIFTSTEIKISTKKTCKVTESSVFFFDKISKLWQRTSLPQALQLSSIKTIEKLDSKTYAFGGNFWDIDPNIGRQDALLTSVFRYEKTLGWTEHKNYFPLTIDQVSSIKKAGDKIFIGSNNRPVKMFLLK